MGLFKKNKDLKATSEKKGMKLNELKEEDLLSIVGGQDFYNESDEHANIENVKQIANKNR